MCEVYRQLNGQGSWVFEFGRDCFVLNNEVHSGFSPPAVDKFFGVHGMNLFYENDKTDKSLVQIADYAIAEKTKHTNKSVTLSD